MINNIYKQVEEHVTKMFEANKKAKLIFHTLDHTKEIVKRTEEIAAHYKLTEKEMMALYTAAWFHDTGHLFVAPQVHEEKSVELMKLFMQSYLPDPELISIIEGCILATKRSVAPTTLLQQIICDADTYHLGTKDFKKTNKLVRKEAMMENAISKEEWDIKTLEFLEHHQYYTSYCIELLKEGKKQNIEKLREKIAEYAVQEDANQL